MEDKPKNHVFCCQGPFPLRKGTEGSAGYDIAICEDAIVQPHKIEKIPTGLKFSINKPYFGRIQERSSTKLLKNLSISGIIDPDYRGNIYLLVVNNGIEPVELKRGDYIAQIIFEMYTDDISFINEIIVDTKRGTGGFGSTDSKEN
jgi:dUTP pyrophosphatase